MIFSKEVNDSLDRIVEQQLELHINLGRDLIHSLNVEAGWWNDPVTGEDLRKNPYAIATKLALVTSEVSEALEAYRKNLMDDHLPDRSGIEVELADAIIRILDLSGVLGLDLGGAVVAKHHYNQSRQDHKVENRQKVGGKKF